VHQARHDPASGVRRNVQIVLQTFKGYGGVRFVTDLIHDGSDDLSTSPPFSAFDSH
jgi:hypothetical protein